MKNLNSKNADFENVSTDNLSFNSVNSDTPQSVNDVLAWNGSSWEVKAAADLGVGGGGGGDVPSSFASNIPAGVESHAITYGPFASTPRIASSLEINGDGEIIPYTMSGVSATGYHVIFSEATANTNYNIHTVFGGESAGESGGGAGSSELVVTVSGGKFFIDGTQQLELSLQRGFSYRFDQSDSTNSGHPIKFSTTSDGTHNTPGGSEYTAGIVYSGTPGSAGAYAQVTLSQSSPNLYYYCGNHSGMGSSALGGITLQANGNVGIGTTSPNVSLEVSGPWDSQFRISRDIQQGQYSEISGGGSSMKFKSATLSTHSVFSFVSDNGTDEIERMRIDSTGDVGIGTSNPGVKLDVVGVGRFNVPAGGSSIISYSLGAATARNQPVFALVTDETNDQDRVRFDSDGDSWFNGGNVGIGTASPTTALTVEGSSGMGGIKYTSGTGSDVLALDIGYTGGGIGLVVKNTNGNVGIGTANPLSQLAVQNSSHGGSIQIGSSSGEDQYQYVNFANNWQIGKNNLTASSIGEPGSLYIHNLDRSTSDFCITSNGNVGIGTTNPSAFDAGVDKLVLDTGTSGGMTIKSGEVGYGAIFFADGTTGNEQYRGFLQYNHGNSPHPSDSLVIGTAGSTKMTILSGGNVGIGTTSPNDKVHIKGDSSDDGGDVCLRIQNPNGEAGTTSSIRFSNTSTPFDHGAITVTREGPYPNLGSMKFFTNQNYDSGNPAITINSLSNVGIGTTNPAQKLDVHGNIAVNGTIVHTSDDRVKHNEQTIVGALETLSKITPKKYIKTTEMYDANHDFELDAGGSPIDENGEPVEHRIEVGVIAQQVLTVDELAFAVSPEGVDEDGKVTSPHGLDYNSLFTYAIAAIQEQQKLIEGLKSRIETLES